MEIKKILALLFLVATIVVQGQLVAFAAEPPGVDSPFGDTGDNTSPPALEGGAADDTSPPALEGGATDDTSPPALEGGATDDDNDTIDTADADAIADIIGAGTQNDTSGGSTNIISESGPGVAFLLIPSLILGYAYKNKK